MSRRGDTEAARAVAVARAINAGHRNPKVVCASHLGNAKGLYPSVPCNYPWALLRERGATEKYRNPRNSTFECLNCGEHFRAVHPEDERMQAVAIATAGGLGIALALLVGALIAMTPGGGMGFGLAAVFFGFAVLIGSASVGWHVIAYTRRERKRQALAFRLWDGSPQAQVGWEAAFRNHGGSHEDIERERRRRDPQRPVTPSAVISGPAHPPPPEYTFDSAAYAHRGATTDSDDPYYRLTSRLMTPEGRVPCVRCRGSGKAPGSPYPERLPCGDCGGRGHLPEVLRSAPLTRAGTISE